MAKGWHGESYRHSLAARGIPTGNFKNIKNEPEPKILADLLILRDRTPMGDSKYHNRMIFNAIEKMGGGEEIGWREYESLRYFIDDLFERKLLSYEDILIIEEIFHGEIGAPLHGWNLSDVDTSSIKYTSFHIVDENGDDIAEMRMWLLDEEGKVPDWDDDEVYDDRKEFLEQVEFVDIEEEWFSDEIEDMPVVDFMRQALPFILKLGRDEGFGLEYSPLLIGGYDEELDALMGSYNFDIVDKRHLGENDYSVRYRYDYRAENPKYIIHTPDGDIPVGDIGILFGDRKE